ncbi:glycosyl hydrolase [Escherichia coli]|uniref:Glycosyl hydrolase n=1 Tax=Escherichia coli TaxID=562 RepID=A0A377K743_ECOLX|nr:glycosyl hydrolase [Escherichia coli]
MVRLSRYPAKHGSVSLTLPVANYVAMSSGLSASGARYAIASRRFVSAEQLPLMALEISITPLDADASVLISTGIDATQTNHGRQHLDETQVRVFGQHLMQGIYTTQDGRSDVAISCCCQVSGERAAMLYRQRAPLAATYQCTTTCGQNADAAKTGVDRLAGRQTRRFRRVG